MKKAAVPRVPGQSVAKGIKEVPAAAVGAAGAGHPSPKILHSPKSIQAGLSTQDAGAGVILAVVPKMLWIPRVYVQRLWKRLLLLLLLWGFVFFLC